MFKTPARRRRGTTAKKQSLIGGSSNSKLLLQQMVGNQAVIKMGGAGAKKPRTRRNIKDKPEGVSKAKMQETAQKKRENSREKTTNARRSYQPGMHGSKKKEQTRLSKKFNFEVTGDTHESEHTIGFEPLNQTSGEKRGVGYRATSLENFAPAYQEVNELHRDHIGTGTTGTRDGSGFNSHEYRNTQRSLLEAGDVSSAVQVNQLGYAFDSKKSMLGTTVGKAATNSFDNMVENLNKVTYAQGDKDVSVPVDAKQKAEMYLSRRAMESGEFPTVEEENAAREKFGVPKYEEQVKEKAKEKAKEETTDMTLGE